MTARVLVVDDLPVNVKLLEAKLLVEYYEVVKAAIIPAMLYFASAFWMVHLEAGKHSLLGLKRSELPSALGALRVGWYLILPLAVLVWLLFSGYTPLFAGTVGLSLTGRTHFFDAEGQALSGVALAAV